MQIMLFFEKNVKKCLLTTDIAETNKFLANFVGFGNYFRACGIFMRMIAFVLVAKI